jgi:arylsulfatase
MDGLHRQHRSVPLGSSRCKTDDPANGFKWELYNIDKDFSQNNDLAASNPDKLRELQELLWAELAKYQVLPLDATSAARLIAKRPSTVAGRTNFVYAGRITGIPHGSAPSILDKSYTITADIEIPQGGAEGMLVTQGGRFGGWGLYLLKGKPVFTYDIVDLERFRWEGSSALTAGKHTVEFAFKYAGGGLSKGGQGILKVDGKTVATKDIPTRWVIFSSG